MKEKKNQTSGTILGMLFGMLAGVALHNIGLWLCLGLAIGVAYDQTKKSASTK